MDAELIKAIVLPFLYNIIGWLYVSLEDDKLEPYEWKKLAQSTIRIGLISFLGAEALAGWGINLDVFAATSGSVLIEFIFKQIEKLKKKK